MQKKVVLKNSDTIKKFEHYLFKEESYVPTKKPGYTLEAEKIEVKTNLLNKLLSFLTPILLQIEKESKELSYDNIDDLIDESRKFIDSLDFYERQILISYTKIGDRIINNIIRGDRSKELGQFVMDNIKKFQNYYELEVVKNLPYNLVEKIGWIPVYIQEFLRVCNKAPKLKYNVTLYRGVQTKDFKSLRPIENEFVSTTIDPDIARNFKAEGECCILNMLVEKGVKALFLAEISHFSEEQEVLLVQPLHFKTVLSDKETVNMFVSNKKIVDNRDIQEMSYDILKARDSLNVIESFTSLKKLPSVMFASNNTETETVLIFSLYYEQQKYFVHVAQDLPVINSPDEEDQKICSDFFFKVVEILSYNGIENIYLHSRTDAYAFFIKYFDVDGETDEFRLYAKKFRGDTGGLSVTCTVF